MKKELFIKNQKIVFSVEGTGVPILMMHGWGMRGSYFDDLAQEMSRLGSFQFIKIDWPGFGESLPQEKSYSLEDYAFFLEEIIKSLELKDYYIVGHSLSGAITIKAASKGLIHPEKVAFCGAAGIRQLTFKKKVFSFFASMGKKMIKLPVLCYFEKRAKKFLYKIAGARDYLEASTEELKQTLRNVVSEDLTPVLNKTDFPVLLLWGEDDIFTPLEHGKIMEKSMPNAELIIIEEAGHALLRKQPKRLAELIVEFFKL